MTKTEAALQVMNPGHPLEQRPIPVKTQPIPTETPGSGALWSSVSVGKPPNSTDSPVVYTCTAAIIPRKNNSQKSSGMSVQAATSAPKPHRGCSSCILAPNQAQGTKENLFSLLSTKKNKPAEPAALRIKAACASFKTFWLRKACKVRALNHTNHSS